ncbi:tRNA uridine-5-carboxymethylaminomethyl(34) synthesis GTPase MnmE [Alkalispirochaeta alkalica]|uniref:tRNA uridine-5-carboxymethylaminomethyl(34) synthesis GTPase MnmE n=1 Tax=Alkalispirochaeta alkalica TaxID=46356 RepID=UPI0003665912|nr:tRNA uridine-5-carboxymethylaminomethyl(34) synthesis GTPase MnmE [Alkalispirochaeta alkalica]
MNSNIISQENDLIAALATPLGSSALAVIRTSGPGCVAAVAALTDRPESLARCPGGRIRRAQLRDPQSGRLLDDLMLGIFRAPRSYTGEEAVELFCHGSVPGVQEILALLFRSGFRRAEPGEFTLRAFLAGKVDLTRAEAVQEIVSSRTARGHGLALGRLGGSVEAEVNRFKDRLVGVMAGIALQLDYPEEETGQIPLDREEVARLREGLLQLAASYSAGKLYQEGVTIALAGKTNAGKSSLFNALLKEDRAIVSDIPGTTRDYIESSLDLGGIPLRIFDTAGLRETREILEGEGIRRTGQLLESADLVLYLVDGTRGVTGEETERLARAATGEGPPCVPVWNKADDGACLPAPEGFFPVSARTLQGIEALLEEVRRQVTPEGRYREGSPVIDSLRQRDLLERAAQALFEVERGIQEEMPVDVLSLDVQEAIHALGEITGEVTSADILDAVFQQFCVGK